MSASVTHVFPAAPVRAARFSVQKAWSLVGSMYRARQTRRMLADMDHRMMADIGVSPSDAHMEAARAFWDLSARR